MKVQELRTGLATIKEAMETWQVSKSTANDLERFAQMLAQFDNLTVTQFCNEIEKALGDGIKSPQKAAINTTTVEDYIQQLEDCHEDRIRFQTAFTNMKIDKAVKLGELTLIANGYVGSSRRYNKKADAYKDIELKFGSKIATTRRLRNIKDVF